MDWWLLAYAALVSLSERTWVLLLLGFVCFGQGVMLAFQSKTIDRLWKLYRDATALYTTRIKQLEDQYDRDIDRTKGPR